MPYKKKVFLLFML